MPRALASLLLLAALGAAACREGAADREPAGGERWQEHAVLTWAEKLKDPDPWVRTSAVTALGDLGADARPASSLLLDLLRTDPAPQVRARAATALAAVGAAQAAGPLLDAVAVDERPVRRASAAALVELGHGSELLELALARLDELPDLGELNEVAHLFAAVGEPAVAPLRSRLLAAETLEERRAAALCLGQVGEPARPAAPDVATLLAEPDTHSRLAAILALAGIGGTEACRELARTAAEDPDAGLRLEALIAGAEPCGFEPAE